jgi:hypothetical protein
VEGPEGGAKDRLEVFEDFLKKLDKGDKEKPNN